MSVSVCLSFSLLQFSFELSLHHCVYLSIFNFDDDGVGGPVRGSLKFLETFFRLGVTKVLF